MHIIIILFFLMVSVCQAEEPGTFNQELDEVVVTASRVEEKVKETPTTTNIVSSEELDNIKFRNPAEALNRLPGIYTHDFGGESELTSIRVPTHFVNGYTMVLVDGIPTTSYGSGSSGNISELNSRNIDRIEVIKGPASALYGSNAIGGIINIITKDPSPEPEVNFWGEYGEHDEYHGGISASGSGRKVSYNLDLNYKNAEGWRDQSAVDKKVASTKFQYAPTESSLLGVKFELLSFDNESSGSLDGEAAFIEDWQHSHYTFTETTMDKYAGTLTYDYFLKNGEFRTVVNVRKIDHTTLPHYRINIVRGGPHADDYHGTFSKIDGFDTNLQLLYSRDMSLWRSKLIVGMDAEYGGTETETDDIEVLGRNPLETLYTYTSYFVLPNTKELLDVTTKVASPYLQFAVSPIERLRITAGGRYDTVTYEVENKLIPAASGDKDFSEFTPKVGATYEITQNLNAYASYSEGFVVPTTSQLFTSSNSNDLLDPEKAKNYEIGFRSFFWNRKIDFDIAAYSMKIEDKILSRDFTSTYYNVAETSMKGIETVLVLHPIDILSLNCSYTYTSNKFENYIVNERVRTNPGVFPPVYAVVPVNYSGNMQPRSPEHHFNARVTVMPFTGFQAELEVDKVSSQYSDEANEASYSRPTLVNLRASYDWKDWSFWAHITNLTDEKYATYVSGDFGDVGYYSGRPRTFFAGLSYTWGR